MASPNSKPNRISLGRLFLPGRLHERFQIDRFHICEFLRHHAVPVMKPGLLVLDAGSGHLKEQMMRDELLATGATLHTCDMNPGPGVDYVADVSDMKFESGAYDIVICTQVMEHVQSPEKTCAELVRVLKPGGHLFLTAPQSANLHNLPWHYFNPTKFGLTLLLEKNQMSIRAVVPQGGHFSQLATTLHYTVPVLQQSSLPGLIKRPLELMARFFFGFVTKVVLLPLDRFDVESRNAPGWCFHAVKPAA